MGKNAIEYLKKEGIPNEVVFQSRTSRFWLSDLLDTYASQNTNQQTQTKHKMNHNQLRFQSYVKMARDHMRGDNPKVGDTVFLSDGGEPHEILELDFQQCYVRTKAGVTRWELIHCYVPF
jgi:hypothetical protein